MSEFNQTIDPNTADLEELTLLPGVGEALAARIIERRPFTSLEDLRRVPGVGKRTLEHMQPMIDFGAQEGSQVPAIDGDEQVDEVSVEAETGRQPVDAAQPEYMTRSQVLGISAAVAAGSAVVSILLMISILIGINRTLDYSRHSAFRDLSSNVNRIEDRLGAIDTDLEGIDRRLGALQGLSGRMTDLEAANTDLQTDVQSAQTQVQQMRTRVEEISLEIEGLARQAKRQSSFFEGLQDLLIDVFGGPQEESAQ